MQKTIMLPLLLACGTRNAAVIAKMSYHEFDFVPVNRVSGWAIEDSGNPRIWWRARLTHDEPVRLTDKSDLREQETQVKIVIGTETPIGQDAVYRRKSSRGEVGWHNLAQMEQVDR